MEQDASSTPPVPPPTPPPSAARHGRMGPGLVGAGVLGALAGLLLGSVGYTAHSAKATSYLSDDPAACINCHIMNEQYDSWLAGPHHARATCNDCHVPHDNVVHKYLVKAEHGYRHSKGFTFDDFHEPIRLGLKDRAMVNQNCVRCHEGLTHEIRTASAPAAQDVASDAWATHGVDCVSCHSTAGHAAKK